MIIQPFENGYNNWWEEWFGASEEPGRGMHATTQCIFLLTFFSKNLIYESHCDLVEFANFDVRENQSMKNATKKAAKKTAKKPAAKKGKK